MAAKFKEGVRYKGELINGSQKCRAVFEYTGGGYFKLLNMHPLLRYYELGESVKIVTNSDSDPCYWSLRNFNSSLENK